MASIPLPQHPFRCFRSPTQLGGQTHGHSQFHGISPFEAPGHKDATWLVNSGGWPQQCDARAIHLVPPASTPMLQQHLPGEGGEGRVRYGEAAGGDGGHFPAVGQLGQPQAGAHSSVGPFDQPLPLSGASAPPRRHSAPVGRGGVGVGGEGGGGGGTHSGGVGGGYQPQGWGEPGSRDGRARANPSPMSARPPSGHHGRHGRLAAHGAAPGTHRGVAQRQVGMGWATSSTSGVGVEHITKIWDWGGTHHRKYGNGVEHITKVWDCGGTRHRKMGTGWNTSPKYVNGVECIDRRKWEWNALSTGGSRGGTQHRQEGMRVECIGRWEWGWSTFLTARDLKPKTLNRK